jgi:hypothetical protein
LLISESGYPVSDRERFSLAAWKSKHFERPDSTSDCDRQIMALTPYGIKGHHENVTKAELLFHHRIDYDDGGIVEMVLWRVPAPVSPSTHGLKYSLFYGRPGVREVGYDNERGKGDHRHYRGAETKYVFSTVEQLMADFWSDVRTLRGST